MSKSKKMSLGDFLGNSNYAPKARLPTGPSGGEDDGSRDGYGRGGREGPRGEGGSHWRGSGRWADDEEDEEAQSAAMTDDNWRRGPPEGSRSEDRGPGGRSFGDRERGGYGDRFGDRDRGFRGEGFGDRGGDRYGDRGGFGGDRYGNRGGFGGDRYGDRGGFGGDRFDDRGGRYGDRDRYGSDRGFGDRGDRGFGSSYGGRGPGGNDSFNEAPSERPAHLKLQLKKRETPIPEPTKPSTEKQEPAKAESVTEPSSPRRKVDPFGGARAVVTKDALEYRNPPSTEKQPEKLDKWARLEAEMLAGTRRESRSGLRTIGGPRSDRRDSGERDNLPRREDPGRRRLSDSPARGEDDRMRPSGSRSPARGGSRSRSPGAREAPVTKVEEKLEKLTVQDEDTSETKPQEEVQKNPTESPEELQRKRDDLISKILESDLRGSALKDWVREQATAAGVELKGGQILAALLRAKAVKSKNDDLKWVTQGQYGALLGSYLYEVPPKEAMDALFEAQRYYIEVGHPKGLLEKLFIQLHQCDVIEDQGFIEWKDDLSDKVPGKTTAIIDVTKFLQWLEEEEEEEEEEEDEEE